MPFSEIYLQQVNLLLRTIPFIAREDSFALKGGTAINLFVRDLPRLSVDIDLTYLPLLSRERSLGAIHKAMKRIADRLERGIRGSQVTQAMQDGILTKLFIRERGVQIKVEVTPVMRGCAYDPELRTVSRSVEDRFGFAAMQVLSFPDLFAGKIVAALDRQHPRDLFDVRDLLAYEGVDDELRAAFIVYLLCHRRPVAEVLAARPKDITDAYANTFEGMTEKPVSLDDLLEARTAIKEAIVGQMPLAHRRFLISFEAGEPDWSLLAIAGVQRLPAVKWRQQNLDTLTRNNRIELVGQLEAVLGHQARPAELTLMPEPSAKPNGNGH